MLSRRLALALLVGFAALATSDVPRAVSAPVAAPPARLTDAEFWRLASGFSEPDGTFHSENLVSNEARFQSIVPSLMATTAPGRAYVGVGLRAELHLYRRGPTGDGVHRGHPARELRSPPDVQGAVRALGKSCRVRVTPVLASSSSRPRTVVDSDRNLRGVFARGPKPVALRPEPSRDPGAPDEDPPIRAASMAIGPESTTCTVRGSPAAPASTTS